MTREAVLQLVLTHDGKGRTGTRWEIIFRPTGRALKIGRSMSIYDFVWMPVSSALANDGRSGHE